MSEPNHQHNEISDSQFNRPGSEVELQLRRINEKLQRLLKQRENLLRENSRLKEELQQHEQKHKDQTSRLEQLQQQVQILKASKNEMNEAEKKILDKRLSQYIRDIDHCIALLGE
jgi:chromosome segregation ATPase